MASGLSILGITSIVILSCWIPDATADQETCASNLRKSVTATTSKKITTYDYEFVSCGDTVCEVKSSRSGTAYYIIYRSIEVPILECCDGYLTENIDPLSCQPLCAAGCYHGECTEKDMCICNVGWKGDKCDIDEDECKEDNHGCTDVCVNTDGSYYCSCHPGYEILSDGMTCQDIPECNSHRHNCTQVCNELPGSYVCGCNAGYVLDDNQYSCTAICNQQCIHGFCGGPNTCICDSGWSGSTCNTVSCEGGCVNGDCMEGNVCICHYGWTGDSCSTGICQNECVHGTCTSPNKCTCHNGWMGHTCNKGICPAGCIEGDCISPNTCSCKPDWSGYTCDNSICHPGYYSESGYEPCKVCPPNYYQLHYGSLSCEPCGNLTNETDHVCVTLLPSATEAVSDEGMTTYLIIGTVTGSTVVIGIIILIPLMIVLCYKKYKKRKFLDYDVYDVRLNRCREVGMRSNSSNGMEMSQVNTNHSARDNQNSTVRSNIPPPPPIDGLLVPKPPPPYVPKPPPSPPPTQLPTFNANLLSNPLPPPKVFSPFSSVLQSSKQSEAQEESDTFKAGGSSKAKEPMKQKEISSTGNFSSTTDASNVQRDGTQANSCVSHKNIPLPPKLAHASVPKSPHVSSSMQPLKSLPTLEKPLRDSRGGTAYSCTVFPEKETSTCNPPASEPDEPSLWSKSTAVSKKHSTISPLIFSKKGGKTQSSKGISFNETLSSKSSSKVATSTLPNVLSMLPTPKPREMPSSTVKSNKKPDPPPKVFSHNSPLAPPAGKNDKQNHFSATPSIGSEAAKNASKEMFKDSDSAKSPFLLSTVYKSSEGNHPSNALIPPNQSTAPKPKPNLPSKLTSELPDGVGEGTRMRERKNSSFFDSPLYDSSAGDLHSVASISHKQEKLTSTKPKLLPKPPHYFSPKDELMLPPYNSPAGELLSSTVVHRKKPMFPKIKSNLPNKPSVALRPPIAQLSSQSNQKGSPSETSNTSKPTTFRREMVNISPNPTPTLSTRQLTPKQTSTKIPYQKFVEIYDDPLDLCATSSQQTPFSRRNRAPLPKPPLHEYEDIDFTVEAKEAPKSN